VLRHMASWEDLWDTVVNTSASLLPTRPSSPQRAPEEDANPPSPTCNVDAAPRSHAAFAATKLCPPQSDQQAWKVTETPRVGSPGVDSSPEQPQETTLSDDDPTPPEQSVAMVVEGQAKKRRHSLGMNEWRKSAHPTKATCPLWETYEEALRALRLRDVSTSGHNNNCLAYSTLVATGAVEATMRAQVQR